MSEPGALALGVTSGVALAALGGLIERNLALEIAAQPRHAMCFHGRQRRIETARRKHPHLIERTRRQHGIEARVDPTIEFLALDLEKDLDGACCIDRRLHAVTMPIGER